MRGLAVVLKDLKQLPVRIFRNNAELSFGFEILYHLDDVGVRQVGQDADLLPQTLQVLLRLTMLWDELHGDCLGRAFAASFEHLAEGAFADLLEHVVVLHYVEVKVKGMAMVMMVGW
jgi:hypothetical protein